MTVPAAVSIVSYDVPSRVDTKGTCLCGSRYIEGGKFSLAQQKAMGVAAAIDIESWDVAPRIDRTRIRQNGSCYIDWRKDTLAQ